MENNFQKTVKIPQFFCDAEHILEVPALHLPIFSLAIAPLPASRMDWPPKKQRPLKLSAASRPDTGLAVLHLRTLLQQSMLP